MTSEFEQAVQRRIANIEEHHYLIGTKKPATRELILGRLKAGQSLGPEDRDWLIAALENKKLPADGRQEIRGNLMLYMMLIHNCVDEGLNVHRNDYRDEEDEPPFCACEVVSEALSRFDIPVTPNHLSNTYYATMKKYRDVEG